MTARLGRGRNGPAITPSSGGTGTVRAPARSGVRPGAESPTPVPVPPPQTDHRALVDRLRRPHLELAAQPAAVSWARRYAQAVLGDSGLKELIEPVELVVSEIVTNAVRASGGLDASQWVVEDAYPVVRLWLSVEGDSVLVLVWDASSSLPQRQKLGPDAEGGRGLLLVEVLSAAWGSFEIADQPGKVVWRLCRS